ncbi:MAG: malto-oligosyltrehalose trehalohydrolase [Steroidobacteraceae bacterium]
MNPPRGFGPAWLPQGGVRFHLFAPGRDRVLLRLDARHGGKGPARTMERDEAGWHWLDCPGVVPGDRYLFDLDGLLVPDPASRYQPEGIGGPSEVCDLEAHAWRVPWRGRDWRDAVVYELHVGCFSDTGDYAGVESKLDHLASLGVTALELMPLAQFAGRRGWGYDGVLPFAAHNTYGRPEHLQRLIDAAHARGLMVLLDVVYNHYGPEGHYIPQYWPGFVNADVHTPWGAAINYDGDGSDTVREFVLQNAIYWLRDFRFDGLRLDAVHAIHDERDPPLLDVLSSRLRRDFPGREIHLIVENEHNTARLLEREQGKPSRFTAQWNDDVHHGLHVALTGEGEGYYGDYDRASQLPLALAEGFSFQGEYMKAAKRERGSPSAHLPPDAFVAFLQNHDQIGNRAFGDRLTALVPDEAIDAALAVLLLSPQVPLLFMGEEWGTRVPFAFFCDFPEPLASAVREGRRKEFAHFAAFRDPAARERIPDPLAESTFVRSKLDWAELSSPTGRLRHALVRGLIARRREEIVPWSSSVTNGGTWSMHGGAFEVRWRGSRTLVLQANLTGMPAAIPEVAGTSLFAIGAASGAKLGPWNVRWTWADD